MNIKQTLKPIAGSYFGFDLEIQILQNKIKTLTETNSEKDLQLKSILDSDLTKTEKINSLQLILDTLEKEKAFENYITNKIPKEDRTYLRQETDGTYGVDVRNFFMINDASIPIVTGTTNDIKALEGLKKVRSICSYTGDKGLYGFDEYWAYAYQTLKRKKGDCEDGAILLANILVKSGVPWCRVRICAGNVWDGRTTAGFLKVADSKYYGDTSLLLLKGTTCGIIQEARQHGLNLDNESVNQQNLRKALFLATKEQEQTESLFANMVGKQLKIDKEFVKAVELMNQSENYTFTTKTKIDSTTLQKTYKYYVALAIVDYMENKGMLDNSEKDLFHGIKGSNTTEGTAGHAYCVYCRETDNEWVVLDWCYWYNTLPVAERPTHKQMRNYFDVERNFYVWFSWDLKNIYAKEELSAEAKAMFG
jgi:hypothetical protein